MASSQVDLEDVVPVTLYPIALGIMLSIFSFSVDVFGGFDLTEALFSISSISVTPAAVGAVASGVAIIATNELDGSDYETYEYAGILGVFLFPVAHMLIPAVQDLVATHEFVAIGVWLAGTVASVWVAYTE